MGSYKDPREKAGSMSISLKPDLEKEYEILVTSLDTTKSKLARALIKYALRNNNKNTNFIREVKEILDAL